MRLRVPLGDDDRAIEGLPIRLVIALVVGVASLGIMMNMLTGIGTLTTTELDVETDPVTIDADSTERVTFTVIDEDGQEVEGATVIVSAGSAQLPDSVHGETEDNGKKRLSLEPDLRQGQGTGTLEIEIVPPSDSDYVDERANNEIVVIE